MDFGTSGTLLRWYAFGAGPNAVLSQMNLSAGTRTTFIPDLQGSLVASLDSGSGALTKAGYQPYGESSSTAGTYRYTGARIDAETGGLYDFRARIYSPALGRFLQADPIGTKGGLNLYAYVGNDPLNAYDPSGLVIEGAVSSYLNTEVPNYDLDTGIAYGTTTRGRKLANYVGIGLGSAALAAAPAAAVDAAATETAGAVGGGLTTTEQLTAAAGRAVQTVGPGSGSTYGTAVHSAFQAEVDALGSSNLATEQSYLNGRLVDYGTRGSVRLDVVEGQLTNPSAYMILRRVMLHLILVEFSRYSRMFQVMGVVFQ